MPRPSSGRCATTTVRAVTSSSAAGARRFGAAPAQVCAALAAHTAAAGCLPSGAALAVALPPALIALLAVATVLRRHPLLALVAGQLAVHACLAASACTVAAHLPHAAGAHPPAHLLMTGAHVGALLLCRATVDLVLRSADAAAAALTRLVRPRVPTRLRLPELPVPRTALRPAPRRRLQCCTSARRRGPPAPPAVLLPA